MRRQFTRNHTYVAGIDGHWQADLDDMHGIARQNGWMRYLLTVIEVFFQVRLSGSGLLQRCQGYYRGIRPDAQGRAPAPFTAPTDRQGQEVLKLGLPALMKRNNIQHFASKSEQKTVVDKRFNHIIKTRIWIYNSDCCTVHWVNVIRDLVKVYNHLHHRSIGMALADVQNKNEGCLWVRLYGNGNTYFTQPIP